MLLQENKELVFQQLEKIAISLSLWVGVKLIKVTTLVNTEAKLTIMGVFLNVLGA